MAAGSQGGSLCSRQRCGASLPRPLLRRLGHRRRASVVAPVAASDLPDWVPKDLSDWAVIVTVLVTGAVQLSELRGGANKAKGGITKLSGEMTDLRNELRGDITKLGDKLRGEMTDLRNELRGEMKDQRSELLDSIESVKTMLFQLLLAGQVNLLEKCLT